MNDPKWKRTLTALFATLALGSIFTCVQAAGSRLKDWDYIVFTQSWPATTCLQWKSEGQGHTCSLPKESTWTVHGVWPSRNNSFGPFFCNNSMPFDEAALSPLLSELKSYWINVDIPTEPYSFWKHEWEKHGTCAASLPAMDKEVKYFGQGLTWLKTYNMYHVLESQGILEGKTILTKRVREAVKRRLGKNPSVHCYRDKKYGKVYIAEIRICFNKNLTLIDCPKACSTNCPPNLPVEYPSIKDVTKRLEVKGKWLFDLLRIVRWIQWTTF